MRLLSRKAIKYMLCLILAILISIQCFGALALDSTIESSTPDDAETAETVTAPGDLTVSNDVKAALLIDVATGQVLFEKSSQQKFNVSTLSRLMTMLIICEAVKNGELKPDDECIVSELAAKVPGSTAFLDTNESVKATTVLKAAGMIQAGDALLTLAEKLCGVEQTFVTKMNERGTALGLSRAFTSAVEQKGELTADDIAKISIALIKTECVFKWTGNYTDQIAHTNGQVTELTNSNKLVRFYSGCDGLATGSSQEAGYSGAFTAERNGFRLLSVVIGANNNNVRSSEAQKMLDYGFANFKSVTLAKEGDVIKKNVPVSNGCVKSVNAVAKNGLSLLFKKGEEKGITKVIKLPEELVPPIEKGGEIGTLVIMQNQKEIASVPLVSSEAIEYSGLAQKFLLILSQWLRL